MSTDNNSNFEDNQFEEYRDQYQEEPIDDDVEVGGQKNNRTFLLAIGVIGGIFVLAVIGLVIFVIMNRGQNAALLQQQAAQINAENTAIARQATEIASQEIQRLTEKAVMPPTWTPTAVVAVATNTPAPTSTSEILAEGDSAARTATVAAFLTQVAQGTPTTAGTPGAGTLVPTSTALPDTGFMDEVGLPGMLGLAFALVLVVFVVRRLRLSTSA